MKNLKSILTLAALTVTLGLVGCEHTLSKTQTTRTSSDGSMKSTETTVTQKADGSVVKTEEVKKTSPTR